MARVSLDVSVIDVSRDKIRMVDFSATKKRWYPSGRKGDVVKNIYVGHR